MNTNIIGIDLGGTIIKVGLFQGGEPVDCIKMKSRLDLGLIPNLPSIEEAVDRLISSNEIRELAGIGLAFPGLVDNKKQSVIATNEKYDDGVELNLAKWADNNWKTPFYIDNDSRLATIGEWQYGSAKGYNNIVMMTIGTGIGSGVIMEGKVMYGKHFQAGSLGGHFVIDYKGRRCSCGNKGCVEALSSSFFLPGIIKEHPDLSDSFKQKAGELDFKEIFSMAREGDKDALLLRNECLDVWSAAIITFIHAYDPEMVILGGGIMNSAGIIMPYLEKRVSGLVWTPSEKVHLRASKLGDYAALYGLKYCLTKES